MFRRGAAWAAPLLLAAPLLAAASPPALPSPAGHVVVVELFTSQGCSTCPPADRLLSSLGAQDRDRVVPLAFHVDIWNSTGWTDPFSRADWTKRQTAYARKFHAATIYTPQAVVDGGAELVGSDAKALNAAIAQAAARPAGRLVLQLRPDGSQVHVTIDVELPDGLRRDSLDLMLAVFETGLVTDVGRGENGGRQLHDDYVVRSLSRAAKLAAGGPSRTRTEASIALDPGWKAQHLGVAAFLQDPASLAIEGAAATMVDSRRE